jgi:hypothetical protein
MRTRPTLTLAGKTLGQHAKAQKLLTIPATMRNNTRVEIGNAYYRWCKTTRIPFLRVQMHGRQKADITMDLMPSAWDVEPVQAQATVLAIMRDYRAVRYVSWGRDLLWIYGCPAAAIEDVLERLRSIPRIPYTHRIRKEPSHV